MSLPVLILLAAVAFAAWFDFRRRCIPNGLAYAALGVCLAAAGFESGLEGLALSLVGAAVCGGLLSLAWRTDAVGGGDVKLAALIGASLGWADGLHALLWTFTIAAVWMLGSVIASRPSPRDVSSSREDLTSGEKVAEGRMRGELLPSPLPSPTAEAYSDDPPHRGRGRIADLERRPMYLAPAALVAAVAMICLGAIG
ncbi:MAG TPA: A24 family peptidase [Caulifigura sp.]|jgi:Flp pilus assembly protein protease CpaA|nr:A24 family peptidase [Caulifigura sp.]